MSQVQNSKQYGLEDRTLKFASEVRMFVRKLPRTMTNIEDAKQLVRASGSIGANFIEAVESLSRKDFLHRAKICRKEAKESRYWLTLLETSELNKERELLFQEATELMKIFGSIVEKAK